MSTTLYEKFRTAKFVTTYDYLSTIEGPYTYSYEVSAASQVLVSTSTGGSNPEWRQMVKNHQDATTSFQATEQTIKGVPKGVHIANHTYVQYVGDPLYLVQTTETTHSGRFPFSTEMPELDGELLEEAYAGASRKAFQAVAQSQKRVQGGAFLGEFREALRMIRSPAKALSSYILDKQYSRYGMALKKARMVKGRPLHGAGLQRNLVNVASNLWLESVFGWNPLIKDISDGYKTLSRLALEPEYYPIEARYTSKKKSVIPLREDWSLEGPVLYTTRRDSKWSATVRVYGEAKNSASTVQLLGIDPIRDFVPTIWELLPYSFLVDYFVNIGEVLDGSFVDLGQVVRASVVSVNYAQHTISYYDFRPGASAPPDTVQAGGTATPMYLKCKFVNREPGFDIATPKLQLSFPTSLRRWTNMGALIGARYRPLQRH